MIQSLGWMQVAKSTQDNVFNSTDRVLAGIRHDGITSSERSPFERTVAGLRIPVPPLQLPTTTVVGLNSEYDRE